MSESFRHMRLVSPELLKERVETIKDLQENEMEAYEILRDTYTNDHYLHYAYLHLQIADGTKEIFHHLLPLDSADVLAIMYGEKEYTYPDHWNASYLRSGPDGQLAWFQPPSIMKENAKEEQFGKTLQDKLATFKEKGSFDDESIKKLLADIEKMADDHEK